MKNNPGDNDKIVNTDNRIINSSEDLQDSPSDAEKMKSETMNMNLPDVKDILGQEHVHEVPLGDLADTTISSDDEEGTDIPGFNDEQDEDITSDTSVNVSQQEKDLLDEAGTAIPDDQQLKQARLDNEDQEGEPLNEGSNSYSGVDLDVPGAEDDDANEEIGEEDEENNDYSLSDSE
jgi:hypothetical protein